jgi:GLPGLI family protein
MKIIFSLFLLVLIGSAGRSQTIFITRGNIEYERKTNSHRLYFSGGDDNSFMDLMKKQVPQFKTDNFNLVFTPTTSVYKFGKATSDSKIPFFESPAGANTVFKDLDHQTTVTQKQIFESQFLISDSLRHIEWKLIPETRTIAGFECHKAITRICDSVVVVAFYTNEIVPANGPESFGGLPGMILELAVPRLYTTWTATKLEQLSAADEQAIMPPAKGKKSNQKELTARVTEGIKDWGEKYRDRALWFVTL